MKITKKLTLQEYDNFCKKKYPNKIPDWYSSDFRRKVGDCIYDFSDVRNPKLRKSVHIEKNKEKDLRGENAIISNHFYYFGNKPISLPDNLKVIIKEGQRHKSKFNEPYVDDFINWIDNSGYEINKVNGEPQLKKEIMKNKDVCSICSNGRYEEAVKDEKIGLNEC